MKKIVLSLLSFLYFLNAVDIGVDGRIMYFDRKFEKLNTPDSTALTIGGNVFLKQNLNDNLIFKTAGYGSFLIKGLTDENSAKSTSMVDVDGNNLNFLGELSVTYNDKDIKASIGRMPLSTPLINGHDLRILPTVYEAAYLTYKTKFNEPTLLYVKKYTGFGSKSNFYSNETVWGDEGLISYVDNITFNKDLKLSLQYVKPVSDTFNLTKVEVSSYYYAELINKYVKLQVMGNDYSNAKDSFAYGAKISSPESSLGTLHFVTDKIKGNRFKAVEAGPLYTDWQQGYANYEQSTAYGLIYEIKKGNWNFKLGSVDVDSNVIGTKTDSFIETNIDVQYTVNKNLSLRTRLSTKDQKSETTKEDRFDGRILVYFKF